ncbi:MAG TPA: sigma-70 family RNA polymerase sigma factor [Bacteroidetes bacterium]|nr:sigma-70 family RNA polymerase sigma factor [Bacteroidota bacterium]
MLKRFRRHTTKQTDEELVGQYQSTGELLQLGILFERYTELVFGLCLKYLKNTALAEDAVMDIFEILVIKAKTHDIRQFRPWLYVLAKNHCLMKLRKKNLTDSFDDMSPSAQAAVVHSAGVVHPIDDFETDGGEKALNDCLKKLPPQQLACVKEFYYEGKSYKQIAEERGEELGRVRSNIQNGRRNLRNCMGRIQTTNND